MVGCGPNFNAAAEFRQGKRPRCYTSEVRGPSSLHRRVRLVPPATIFGLEVEEDTDEVCHQAWQGDVCGCCCHFDGVAEQHLEGIDGEGRGAAGSGRHPRSEAEPVRTCAREIPESAALSTPGRARGSPAVPASPPDIVRPFSIRHPNHPRARVCTADTTAAYR